MTTFSFSILPLLVWLGWVLVTSLVLALLVFLIGSGWRR